MTDSTAILAQLRRVTSRVPVRAVLAGLVCLVGIYVYADAVERVYPIDQWLFWKVLPIWTAIAAFTLACLCSGQLLLRRIFRLRDLPALESGLWAMTLGTCAFTIGLYALGAVGGFKTAPMIALPLALTIAGVPDFWAWLREERVVSSDPAPRGFMRLLWFVVTVLGAACILLLYLETFTPGSINFDASWYHIPIGQDYAREHRIVAFPGDVNRAFPHFASMLYAWGFSLPGMLPDQHWMLALHFEFLFVLWKIVGAAAAARYLLSGKVVPGLWTAFFLFPSLFVYDQNPGGSADHFLGFFAAPVLLGSLRTVQRFEPRRAALLGVALGGAMLTKYQAVYLIAVSGALLLPRMLWIFGREIHRRRRKRPVLLGGKRVLRATLLCTALAFGVAGPHFIKNAVFYHNPVYPMAQSIFKGSRPQHEKTALYFEKAYPTKQHLPKGQGLERQRIALENFFTFSFKPHYSFTRGYPSMGSLFTLLLPCLLFIRDRKKPALAIWATFAGVWMWSNTYTSDRYLQALVPLFVAVTGTLIVRTWELGIWARLGLVPLVLFQLVWSGDIPFYSGYKRLISAVELIRSGYENQRGDAQRFRYRREHKAITLATPPDARILVRNYRTTLGIDREVLFDIQAWQSLLFYEPLKSPRELFDFCKAQGITHLLYPKGQRAPDTLQNTILFDALAEYHGQDRQRFGGLVLVTLPKEPPPPDPLPFHVLVAGVRYYKDGLYRVEQLTVHKRIPPAADEAPKPEKALTSANSGELLEEAQVVALGSGRSALKTQASEEFFEVERLKEYTLLLRKRGEHQEAADAPSLESGSPESPPSPDDDDL